VYSETVESICFADSYAKEMLQWKSSAMLIGLIVYVPTVICDAYLFFSNQPLSHISSYRWSGAGLLPGGKDVLQFSVELHVIAGSAHTVSLSNAG